MMLKKLVGLYKRKVIDAHSSIPGVSDVTAVQGWVICFIYDQNTHKDVFQRDVEQELDITKSSVTNLLQRMEKKGFLIRTPMPHDARWKKLELTQKAIDFRNEIRLRMIQVERQAISGVTESELLNFLRVTEIIAGNLEGKKSSAN
jgi:Transcriptional regulators